jgi:hypothetical protein
MSRSSYSSKTSEERHVPARFLIKGEIRATGDTKVTVRVPKRKRCGDVKHIIKDDARRVISSTLNYSGDFDIDLIADNKALKEDDSTDLISSVGMIILGNNSTILDTIIGRITLLEADVAYIKLRVLIEQGRGKYWERYRHNYKDILSESDRLKFISSYEYYTDFDTKVIEETAKDWRHFLLFVQKYTKDADINSLIEILDGGKHSMYHNLSNSIHQDMTELQAATVLKNVDDKRFEDLFHFVFGKHVSEVIALA